MAAILKSGCHFDSDHLISCLFSHFDSDRLISCLFSYLFPYGLRVTKI